MYTLDVNTFITSLHTLLGNVQAAIPTDVRMQIQASGDIINDVDGALLDTWTFPATTPVQGTNAAVYAAPAGMILGWDTKTVLDGKRVRGRNFLVPLAGDQYETNGSLLNATVTAFEAFCASFIFEQSQSFVIWHRPRAARAAVGTRPALTAHVGGHALVTTSRIPDRVAVLRSRRD